MIRCDRIACSLLSFCCCQRYITDKSQRILNAAARLVSGTTKYDRGLSSVPHDDLQWRDVTERIRYKLNWHHSAPISTRYQKYLVVVDLVVRRHL